MAIEDTYFKMAEEQDDEALKMVLNTAGHALQNMRKKLERAQERIKKLDALETWGVDNWEGYDEAMRSPDPDEDDED